ncbi:MAG: hypothetical protein Q8M16_13305 [Pirellulaceae bacterium]|nr:hypothetical protein [Pirellulaceae bacterium]
MNTRMLNATLFSLHLLALPFAVGQEQGRTDEKQPEMLTMQVLVVDPDGHPVENAIVSLFALRAKGDGQHLTWDEEKLGRKPERRTNAAGLVDLPYPKVMEEEFEVGQLRLSVKHLDFVTFLEDRHVDEQPAKAELKRGFRIAAAVVDAETAQPITQDLYGLISSESILSDWKLADNGMLVSPVFESKKAWLRLIKLSPGQPNLYSELIPIDPTDRSRILLRDVKLSKGTRVEGRLEESIPRPIGNGYVAAMIVRNGPDNRFRWNSQWVWHDRADIADDGTFVFESLPTDEVLQLIPICDDWVPKNPRNEEVLPFYPEAAEKITSSFTFPQLFLLSAPQIAPTLKMVPATSVQVTVVDQDGKPMLGVEVASWPNQAWFDGGGQILGLARATSDWLKRARHGGPNQPYPSRYSAMTDANGVAVIRSMPADRTEGLVALLDGFEMPLNGTEREIRIDLKPGVVNEVTIKMQPAGTQVLKDKTFDLEDKDDDAAINKEVDADDDCQASN